MNECSAYVGLGVHKSAIAVAVPGREEPVYRGEVKSRLDRWCIRTMRSRLDPMKRVARMVRSHRGLILNWSRVRGELSNGIVEDFNGKARVTTKKAFGYRTPPVAERRPACSTARRDAPERHRAGPRCARSRDAGQSAGSVAPSTTPSPSPGSA